MIGWLVKIVILAKKKDLAGVKAGTLIMLKTSQRL